MLNVYVYSIFRSFNFYELLLVYSKNLIGFCFFFIDGLLYYNFFLFLIVENMEVLLWVFVVFILFLIN